MSVEKLSRFKSKLEDLGRERQKIVAELSDKQRKLAELDGVILRFLGMKITTLEDHPEPRAAKRKCG